MGAPHKVGDLVEVLDSSSGWVPARVLQVNGNGSYDVSVRLEDTVHLGDVAAVLSLMCSGSQGAKMSSALRFYTTDGGGSLTFAGLRAYLTSVFKVIFEAQPERQYAYSRGAGELLSPKKMGDATARRAFGDHGLSLDMELETEAFKRWYAYHLDGGGSQAPREAQGEPEGAVERVLGGDEERAPPDWTVGAVAAEAFAGVDVDEAFARLGRWTDARGRISRGAFGAALADVVHDGASSASFSAATSTLFDAFDTDGDGTIDFAELGAGLSVLCGGEGEAKVRATFALFDLDGNGTIEFAEMVRYLRAVFRVAFAKDPALDGRVAASPEQLAEATARAAFEQCDVNHDGKLNFAEFRAWYHSQQGWGGAAFDRLVTEKDALEELSVALRGLDPTSVFDRLGYFADEDGCHTRLRFYAAFEALFEPQDDARGDAALRAVLDAAFDAFDTDHDGVVDAAELAAGLGALCGGSRLDKIKLTFDLFDRDHDGFLDEYEIRAYLAAVYKVSTATLVDDRGEAVTADELAAETALAIVREADADGDGRVSFDEFARWVSSERVEDVEDVDDVDDDDDDDAAAAGAGDDDDDDGDSYYEDETEDDDDDGPRVSRPRASDVPPAPASAAVAVAELRDARRLLNLDHFSLDEVVEVVVESAPRGSVSADAFAKICRRLQTLGGNCRDSYDDRVDAARLADRVYRCFDADEADDVDFVELASGLCVLSPAPVDEKIEAAFALYDVAKGIVSFDELRLYLLSIYKVLMACSNDLQAKMAKAGGPEKLAHATAKQCFLDARLPSGAKVDCATFKNFIIQGIARPYDLPN